MFPRGIGLVAAFSESHPRGSWLLHAPAQICRAPPRSGEILRIFARTVNIEAIFEAFPICEDFVP